jgi:hypothetical protein
MTVTFALVCTLLGALMGSSSSEEPDHPPPESLDFLDQFYALLLASAALAPVSLPLKLLASLIMNDLMKVYNNQQNYNQYYFEKNMYNTSMSN